MLLTESDRRSINMSALRRSLLRSDALTRRDAYTEQEIALIRKHYPNYEVLCELLPRRTKRSIQDAASHRGMCRPRHIWTNHEVARLRRMYPSASWEAMLAAFPHLKRLQIVKKAVRLHIPRGRPALIPTGSPLLDSIRARSRELNLTLSDLDAMVGAHHYFLNKWRFRVDYRLAYKAIQALDGNVEVIWN